MGHYDEFYEARDKRAVIDAYYKGPDDPATLGTFELKYRLAEARLIEKELAEIKRALGTITKYGKRY